MSTPKKRGKRLAKKLGKKIRNPENPDRKPKPIKSYKDDGRMGKPWKSSIPVSGAKRSKDQAPKISPTRAKTRRK